MIILPNQHAVFVHVPKTGGDSIGEFLLKNVPGAYSPGVGKHWAQWQHGPITPPGWARFAFVREPVAWYRSFWSYIYDQHVNPYHEYPVFEEGQYHPMRQWEQFPWTSWEQFNPEHFHQFVMSVYALDTAYYTRLIEWLCGPENARMMRFIGKQEHLARDLENILAKLGMVEIARKVPTLFRRINTSRSKFTVADETKQLIQAHEHSIYRRFGYKK